MKHEIHYIVAHDRRDIMASHRARPCWTIHSREFATQPCHCGYEPSQYDLAHMNKAALQHIAGEVKLCRKCAKRRLLLETLQDPVYPAEAAVYLKDDGLIEVKTLKEEDALLAKDPIGQRSTQVCGIFKDNFRSLYKEGYTHFRIVQLSHGFDIRAWCTPNASV